MNSIYSNIARRAKKTLIILIILPLLAGIIGYVLEKKAAPAYSAKTTIELGNFQNQGWTNPQEVANILTSVDNLNSWLPKSVNPDYVKSHLNILANPTSDLVHIEYVGTSLTDANNTLTAVMNGFMNASNSLYNAKRNIVQSAVTNLNNVHTQYYDQPKDLSDLSLTLTDYKPTTTFEKISAASAYVNPFKRGIFGLIIGIMLDIIILALPEMFRDFR